MISLFFWNGPYISDSYEENSIFGSFWGVRSLKPEIIEEMEYELEEQRVKEFEIAKGFISNGNGGSILETPRFLDASNQNNEAKMCISYSER